MATLQENIRQANSDFNAIKAEIVNAGVEVSEGTKTEEYSVKIRQVYEKGVDDANEEIEHLNDRLEQIIGGGTTGYKSHYHEFWDNYQQNGDRTNYQGAFMGYGWTEKTLKPKYDMTPSRADNMFKVVTSMQIDFVEYLKKLDVTLDFSQCTNFNETFSYCKFDRIGVVDTTSATNLGTTFSNSGMRTIDKLVLKSDGSQTFSSPFNNCTNLENIIIEGVIGKNGFNIQHSTKLSKASIESIINALSITTSGLTVTLSKTAVNNAFTTDEWNTLIATKSNWTISLV